MVSVVCECGAYGLCDVCGALWVWYVWFVWRVWCDGEVCTMNLAIHQRQKEDAGN